MKSYKLYLAIFLILFLSINNSSAAITSINYPYNNDIIPNTARIQLNISSSGSTGCVFYYDTPTGTVAFNQSIACNGVSLVNLPNAEGAYNLTVEDSAASTQTITVTVDKPAGILITAIYILTFFLFLSMLFLIILNIARLATFSMTIFDVAISLSVYFGMLILYQLSIEYINVPFFIGWLDLIQLGNIGWLFVAFPIIAFFVSFTYKGTQKKKLPSVQEMTGDVRRVGRYG